MTDSEMRIVRDILWDCGEVLACFDERTEDKRLLFVTADEPAMLRYILTSPAYTEEQKQNAHSTLDRLMEEKEQGLLRRAPFQEAQYLFEAEGSVLYCAPEASV